jgi:hypothetical protein
LAGFLQIILSPLAGRSDSFVKDFGHFIELLKSVNLRGLDILVSFDVISLFTNVPVYEALQVIRSRLDNDNNLAELSVMGFWMSARGPRTFKGTTDSNSRRMEWQWVVPFVPIVSNI